MSPTLVVVVFSTLGVALFVYGVLMMSRRQEGGSGRSPALIMVAGIALLAVGMLAGLMLKWAETIPTQPHFEVLGVGDPAAPPPAPASAPAH